MALRSPTIRAPLGGHRPERVRDDGARPLDGRRRQPGAPGSRRGPRHPDRHLDRAGKGPAARRDQAALTNAISQQQSQLGSTRSQIGSDSSSYSSIVNGMTSRLQSGTTPGNPDLVNQWNQAQAKLDGVVLGVGTLNSLATQVTTEASVAGYLLENVRATYLVGGATEEDHRNLRSIEGEVTRSMQQIDRLIADLNAEISARTASSAASASTSRRWLTASISAASGRPACSSALR